MGNCASAQAKQQRASRKVEPFVAEPEAPATGDAAKETDADKADANKQDAVEAQDSSTKAPESKAATSSPATSGEAEGPDVDVGLPGAVPDGSDDEKEEPAAAAEQDEAPKSPEQAKADEHRTASAAVVERRTSEADEAKMAAVQKSPRAPERKDEKEAASSAKSYVDDLVAKHSPVPSDNEASAKADEAQKTQEDEAAEKAKQADVAKPAPEPAAAESAEKPAPTAEDAAAGGDAADKPKEEPKVEEPKPEAKPAPVPCGDPTKVLFPLSQKDGEGADVGEADPAPAVGHWRETRKGFNKFVKERVWPADERQKHNAFCLNDEQSLIGEMMKDDDAPGAKMAPVQWCWVRMPGAAEADQTAPPTHKTADALIGFRIIRLAFSSSVHLVHFSVACDAKADSAAKDKRIADVLLEVRKQLFQNLRVATVRLTLNFVEHALSESEYAELRKDKRYAENPDKAPKTRWAVHEDLNDLVKDRSDEGCRFRWFQLCNYSDGRRGQVMSAKRGTVPSDCIDAENPQMPDADHQYLNCASRLSAEERAVPEEQEG